MMLVAIVLLLLKLFQVRLGTFGDHLDATKHASEEAKTSPAKIYQWDEEESAGESFKVPQKKVREREAKLFPTFFPSFRAYVSYFRQGTKTMMLAFVPSRYSPLLSLESNAMLHLARIAFNSRLGCKMTPLSISLWQTLIFENAMLSLSMRDKNMPCVTRKCS